MSGRVDFFEVFWLRVWSLGGLCAAFSVAWLVNGREIVMVRRTPPSQSVQRSLFGISFWEAQTRGSSIPDRNQPRRFVWRKRELAAFQKAHLALIHPGAHDAVAGMRGRV